MPKFVYIGYDQTGVRRRGESTGVSRESVVILLKEQGLVPVSVRRIEDTHAGADISHWFNRKPGPADLEFLTSQLSLLLRNGIRIDKALETAKTGLTNKRIKKIVDALYQDVRTGLPLSSSMEKHREIFDALYISVVRIGEVTGRLADVFADLASNLEFTQKISSRTRQAMIYPSIVFAVCLLSIIFIFNFIVPRFSAIFAGMKTVPFFTATLLRFSELFVSVQYFLPLVVVGVFFLFCRVLRNKRFRQVQDEIMVRLPLVRSFSYNVENLRFASSMAILLKSGVVITEALDNAIRSIGNTAIRKSLSTLKDAVREGKTLSESMAKIGFFPDIYNGLIETGEKTGNLSEIFFELQKRLTQEYEKRVEGLIVVIEPAMIIIMGLVVGTVVVTMFLSMAAISDIGF